MAIFLSVYDHKGSFSYKVECVPFSTVCKFAPDFFFFFSVILDDS